MVDNFTCFFHLIMKGEFVYSIVTFYGNVDVTLCSRDIYGAICIYISCLYYSYNYVYLPIENLYQIMPQKIFVIH